MMLRKSSNISKLIAIAALGVALLSSCSKDENYDRAKAVSVFVSIDHTQADESLKNTAITLPAQQQSVQWNGSASQQNQLLENIAKNFTFRKNQQLVVKKSDVIWSGYKADFDNRYVFAPVIVNDKIFTLDTHGNLFSYNLSDKKQNWKSRLFPRMLLKNYQTPRIFAQGDKIYAIAGTNRVVAASQATGEIIWSKDISAIAVATPTADENLVYVLTNTNRLYALNSKDGTLQWTNSGIPRPTAIFGAANPVVYKNAVVVAYSSGQVVAVDRKSGETIWSKDLNLSKAVNADFYLTDIDAAPIVKDDVIYSIGNGGLMAAINFKSGEFIWKKEIAGITDFWLAGQWLYVINNSSKMMAIQRSSGLVKWSVQLPELVNKKKPQSKIIYNGLILAGDKLVVSSSRGDIIIASPFDGKIEKTTSFGKQTFHAPVIVGNKFYFHALGSWFFVDLVELE